MDSKTRIDLGLLIAEQRAQRGIPMTQKEIAAYCGVTRSAIYMMEVEAKKKMRSELYRRGFKQLGDLFDSDAI